MKHPAPLAVTMDRRAPLAVALERRERIKAALDTAHANGFDAVRIKADLACVEGEIHLLESRRDSSNHHPNH